MSESATNLELFTPLDWPDASERQYIVLKCFGCYREYRGPRNEPYCWSCTTAWNVANNREPRS